MLLERFFAKALAAELNVQRLSFSSDISQTLEEANALETIVVGFHRSNDSPWKASNFTAKELELLNVLTQNHKVILVSFVKPYALSKLDNLDNFSTLLVGYQNNIEAQTAAVDVLLGRGEVSGRLPVTIAPDYPEGSGMDIQFDKPLEEGDPFAVGVDAEQLKALDTLAQVVIDSMMAPGMQILAARKGKIVYHKAFGHHTYRKQRPVALDDVYDLAASSSVDEIPDEKERR